MCFRVEISKPAAIVELLKKLNLSLDGELATAFNLGPSTALPVLWQSNSLQCAQMSWGLTPRYWKQGTKPKPLANARSESLWDRANFRSLANSHHCVVLVTGFYEWQRQNSSKQPYRFTSASKDDPLCLAGIWQSDTHDGQTTHQCCVITTAPNRQMAPIHNRMPVIIKEDEIPDWLCANDRATTTSFLHPCDEAVLKHYPVSTYVNSVRNTGPQCIAPIDDSKNG